MKIASAITGVTAAVLLAHVVGAHGWPTMLVLALIAGAVTAAAEDVIRQLM